MNKFNSPAQVGGNDEWAQSQFFEKIENDHYDPNDDRPIKAKGSY